MLHNYNAFSHFRIFAFSHFHIFAFSHFQIFTGKLVLEASLDKEVLINFEDILTLH